jgi:glycine cleavage system aminomethyltransferase T
MLEHGIALALVDSSLDLEPSATFEIDQRGRSIPATVVATPFTRPGQWATTPETQG